MPSQRRHGADMPNIGGTRTSSPSARPPIPHHPPQVETLNITAHSIISMGCGLQQAKKRRPVFCFRKKASRRMPASKGESRSQRIASGQSAPWLRVHARHTLPATMNPPPLSHLKGEKAMARLPRAGGDDERSREKLWARILCPSAQVWQKKGKDPSS
ncbi:hypothetical protein EJ06DRAFT_532838 [Trichodelitschia bisporula]|uniref:Uncharacterized protein n=1 Tax=Trichodelitschia bisporula TaxID=703511 RepID=A0A6G1HPC5_9PEZI|nr:hypothetical protein EJ06DRAFT_532838 [Trichodelitschia bisporula]